MTSAFVATASGPNATLWPVPVLDGNFFTLAEVALAMGVDEARVREWIEMLAVPWTYMREAGGPAVRCP